MGSISDYLEDKLLDHVFNTAYSKPATVYLGLSTADPLDDASGLAEPSGNGYVRKAITFGAAASRSITQSGDVNFDEASGSWGTLTHWGVFDAESGGNMMAHGALNDSKAVVSGNTPSVASGEVVISFNAGDISTYLANKLLDLAFRNQTYASPDTYIGLCTADIVDGDDGDTVTECSGNGYARKEVRPNGSSYEPNWDLSSGGVVDNGQDIVFASPTGSWGTVTAIGIFDALTSGNLLFYDNTVTDQEPDNGDTVKIAAGGCTITMT